MKSISAQLWLFDAVGRLKFKAEPFNGRLAENFHGLLELGREILGHLLAALPFFEIIDERYGVAADGFFWRKSPKCITIGMRPKALPNLSYSLSWTDHLLQRPWKLR